MRRTVILQQLLDQVYVGKHHSATTVTLELEPIQCFTVSKIVSVPGSDAKSDD